MKHIRVIGIPEEEEREREVEGILEKIIVENFPNLVKGTSIKIQEAQRTPSKPIKKVNIPSSNIKT